MNKLSLIKITPYVLAIGLTITGCGEKSDCEIPSRHVHKYVKAFDNDIKIEKYMDKETLDYFGYHLTDDYIEMTKEDEKFYKLIGRKGLFNGKDNWDYLYNVMATHHDYLEFYYEYTTIETYTETDEDGNIEVKTRVVEHNGWHKNPYDSDNTGKTRLYHHRYYGYNIIKKNNKFKAEQSEAVDDIRKIIDKYPYFSEDCISKVYEQYKFSKYDLPYLSPDDFDVFEQPDLENKNITSSDVKVKRK